MSTVLPPNVESQRDPLRRGASTNSKMAMPRIIRLSAMALALTGVAAFGVIVYSAYQGNTTTPDQVPLITADNAPLRERPAEEGGMIIANRDSTVYSQMDGTTAQPGLERLVPPPESPLDPIAPDSLTEPRRPDGTPALTADEIRLMHQQRRAQQQRGDAGEQAMQQLSEAAGNLPAGVTEGHTSTVIARAEQLEPPAADAPVAAAPEVIAAPEAPVEAPVAITGIRPPDQRIIGSYPQPGTPYEPAAPAAAAAAPAASTSTEEQPLASLSQAQIVAQGTRPRTANPAALPAATPQAAPAAPTAQEARQAAAIAPAAGVAGRVIQLGAVRTQESASAEWTRLQAKYRAQLGGLSPEIQQVDLGARGIYWRIRGGSVSDAQGKQICEALKAAGQSCLVVNR